MRKYKVLVAVFMIAVLVVGGVVSVYAHDTELTNVSSQSPFLGDLYTRIPNLRKYEADYYFDACLARSFFVQQEAPQTTVIAKKRSTDSNEYVRFSGLTAGKRYTLMITAYKPTNMDMVLTIYYVYTDSTATGSYVRVDGIPEEYGAIGAPITVVSDGALLAVHKEQMFFDRNDDLYFAMSKLTSDTATYNWISSASAQSMQLGANEQIVYCEAMIGGGWNDLYVYGAYSYAQESKLDGAKKWINAYKVYQGIIGEGGGFTQDDLDNAYDDGYMDGEQIGYHQGAQDGYDSGYANGYDEGYSFSAGAEEIESAYEDGKADGLVEGYQNGKADGATEGYANGYTAGYDSGYEDGLETGYEDGKADGLVEGYQNGKADGVTEGYANGYTAGYDTGYDTGYDEGYDYGYNLGEGVGSTEIDIGEIISAVPEGAKSIINGALGFEIFGINVAGTLTALLVVAIVAFVVKKLMTR